MDDFENSFKRCKIEELSGQTENMTSSDAESISLTTRTTTKPITMLTDAINNDRNDAKSISLTTNPITVLTDGMDNGRKDAETISLTTTQTTILTDTENCCWAQICTQLLA